MKPHRLLSFKLREHFMSQSTMVKWDVVRLDEYILLPAHYGFLNNADCFFISHSWKTPLPPDPQGKDLSLFHEDLQGQSWSYVWLDWICMPQFPRSSIEETCFCKTLQCIPLIAQDCAFGWRFPGSEARAWTVSRWLSGYLTTVDLHR